MRILARRLDAALEPYGLESVLGVLQPVALGVGKPEARKPPSAFAAVYGVVPYSDVAVGKAGVGLDRHVHVFVGDERARRIQRAALPYEVRIAHEIVVSLDPVAREVRCRRHLHPSPFVLAVRLRCALPHRLGHGVLLDHEAVRVHLLELPVQRRAERGAEVALVASAVDRKRHVAAEVLAKLLRVFKRLERVFVFRIVAVVRQFGLQHQPELVGDLEELRAFAARVEPCEVEARLAHHPYEAAALAAVGQEISVDRVHVVEAAAPHEERLAVEVEVLAAHFQLANAEALAACLQHGGSVAKRDFRDVEVRVLGVPRTEVGQRHAQHVLPELCGLRRHGALDVRAQHHSARNRLRRVHEHVHLGALRVEVAAHPCVVDVRRGRRLQLDAAQKPAPAAGGLRRAPLRRKRIGGLRHDLRLFAWLDERSDLVLARRAEVVYVGDRHVVHPEPALAADAANLEPDALAAPFFGDLHLAAIPSVADEAVLQREPAARVPSVAATRGERAWLADALPLPCAGHAYPALAWPFVGVRHLRAVGPGLHGGESPLAAEVDDCAGLVAADRVHHGRVGLYPAPADAAFCLRDCGGGDRRRRNEKPCQERACDGCTTAAPDWFQGFCNLHIVNMMQGCHCLICSLPNRQPDRQQTTSH